MKAHVLHAYAFNLNYTRMLTADLKPQEWTAQPAGLTNHAAWIVGHLISSSDTVASNLGLPPICPPQWKPLFGIGSKATAEPGKYPEPAALLKALEDAHARIAAAFERTDEQTFDKPNPSPNERFRKMFPTVGAIAVGLMTTHEATHLGQLSAVRRALGYPPLI